MHACRPIPYLIRNISAAHLLVDKEYNSKLYDFGMISGGNLTDKRDLLNQYVLGCYGYIDPDYMRNGKWSEKCDMFAYDVILISLISKQIVIDEPRITSREPFLYEWAHSKYERLTKEHKTYNFSLVHKSFEYEAPFTTFDGIMLSKLAIKCVDKDPLKRPTMRQVVERLKKLHIIQFHAILGFENVSSASTFLIPEMEKGMVKKLTSYSNIKRNTQKALTKKLRGKDISKLSKKVKRQFVPPCVISNMDLKKFTDEFSDKNYIDTYQFGKLYHGKVNSRAVTVRTWEDVNGFTNREGENERRFREELIVLQHPKFVSHPHIVKMIGYCYEDGKCGGVYDLESLGSLGNLIEKDSFTWRLRIDFAIKLAGVLKYLQDSNPPYEVYVLRNLFLDNILVDKDYNPKLFNFGMLLGGILNDKEQFYRLPFRGWLHCIDPYTNCDEYFCTVSEIYSFGMVLLNLITKKAEIKGQLYYYHNWPHKEYKRAAALGDWGMKHFSLADKSFGDETDFDFIQGQQVSKLVLQCIHRAYFERPTIG